MINRRFAWIFALPVLLLVLTASAGCTPQFFDATSWSGVVSEKDSPVVYYGSKFGGVVALDVQTRQQAWRQPPATGNAEKDARRAVYSTPLAHNGVLYFGDYDGGVYAVALDGTVKWQKTVPGRVLTDPIFHEKSPTQGLVIFGTSGGKVHAFDIATGAEAWSIAAGTRPIWGAPAVRDGLLYVPSMDGTLYAIDLDAQKEAWRFVTDAPLAGPVLVNGANVIFGSFDKKLYALDTVTQKPAWTFPGENWFWTRPAIYDGVLYAGGLDHNVYALDPVTGAKRWLFRTDGPVRATPTLVNDKIVVGSEDGSVYAITLSGVLAWKTELAVPVYVQVSHVGDALYVTGQDGQLYALDATTGVRRWAFDSQKKES